jgi:predicted nucleic acid-binding protein
MTSLDTNVILAVFDPKDASHELASAIFERLGSHGLVLCPVVYTELAASQSWEGLRAFLERGGVEVLWEMPLSLWERAGKAMGGYARSRRGGELPRRVAADFLVGAHAEHYDLTIATLDPVVFRAVFPSVPLITA